MMAILKFSDQFSHDLTADLNSATRYLKMAIILSMATHVFLLVINFNTRTIYQAMPQSHNTSTTIKLSLRQQKLQTQLKTPSRPKIAKRKAVLKPKKTTSSKTRQAQAQAASAPKTFDFYIQDFVEPIYPRIAQRRGITGKVVLLLKVDQSGKVVQVNISQSSGHSMLDESAVKAARKWKFRPLAPNMAQVVLNKKIVFTM